MRLEYLYSCQVFNSCFIFLTSGEGAFENDPTEGGSQSAGVQAEVFNMSQHFPSVQKALVFTFLI